LISVPLENLDTPLSQSTTYRADIDGLRAVSILLILATHLGVDWARGGFIGVDVFFVISGFVICRGALSDLERGQFSLREFYWRRFRRIWPNLATVLAATVVVGMLMLSPRELESLSESALAALFFSANIYFNDHSGYFAPAAHDLPLLHTWSLGVEEQFYLLLPPLFVWGLRWNARAGPAVLIISVTVMSLIYCVVATDLAPQHAFYLPMSRMWEIGVGGCAALLERVWTPKRLFSEVAGILGLALIAFGLLWIDGTTVFPGITALIPVAGSALIVLSGPSPTFVGAALKSSPMVAVGRLSYALYLVHWPMIVYSRVVAGRELSAIEILILLVAILASAFLLMRYVETPLRSSANLGDRKAKVVLVGSGICIVLFAILIVTGGLPGRLNDSARIAIANFERSEKTRRPCIADGQWHNAGIARVSSCRWGAEDQTDFILIGDSHASAMADELANELLHAGAKGGITVGKPGCAPLFDTYITGKGFADCPNFNKLILAEIARTRPRFVFLIARWATLGSEVRAPGDGEAPRLIFTGPTQRQRTTLQASLLATVRQIEATGARVVIVGPVPEIDFDVPNALVRNLWLGNAFPVTSRAKFDVRQRQSLAAIAATVTRTHAIAIYPHELFCDTSACRISDGAKPLYIDDDHLSHVGALVVATHIAKSIWQH